MAKKQKARRWSMSIPPLVGVVFLVCAVLMVLALGLVALNAVLNMGE